MISFADYSFKQGQVLLMLLSQIWVRLAQYRIVL